jgi:peroxiredoxin
MHPMTALAAGSQAPEFSLAGIDGREHSLRHPGEGATMLVFFKNSCPTCMLAFPFLQRLYERVEGAPLRFWGISQDGAPETRVFGEQQGASFPLLPDGMGYPVSNAYGLTNVPTLFLVEPDGTISRTSVGFSRADLEGLAAEFRNRFRLPGVTPLFVASDQAPALKPG